MKITGRRGKYLVYRPHNRTWFSFYVDHDKSSWTGREHLGTTFKTRSEAQNCIDEVNKRVSVRRREMREWKRANER